MERVLLGVVDNPIALRGLGSLAPEKASKTLDPDLPYTGKMELHDIINFSKYPIQNLNTAKAKSLVAECQQKMHLDGSLLLESFIKPEHIAQMCAECTGLEAHRRLEIVNVMKRDPWVNKEIYQKGEALPKDHPALFRMPQDVHAVASDLVPQDSLLRRVYDSELVMDFVAAVVNQPKIYQYGDEFQALNVMYMRDGGSRAWHYDGSDYVVTLMLQASDVGGDFEYAPFIRGEQVGVENFDQVQQLFRGNWATKTTRCMAGALAIFNGRRSLHRVRTVFGKKERIQSVLSYAKTSGEHSTPEKNVTLYGKRVEDIYEARGITLNRNASGEVVVAANTPTINQGPSSMRTMSKL